MLASTLLCPIPALAATSSHTGNAETSGHTAVAADVVTDVGVQNTGTAAQTSVPITFGQAFAAGDVPAKTAISARIGDHETLPMQFDVKANYPDGSVRHAVISAVLPSLPAGKKSQVIQLVKAGPLVSASSARPAAGDTPAALLEAGFNADVKITLDGHTYTAAAAPALKNGAVERWLSGPIVNEWLVTVPLVSEIGAKHPHLSVHYAIRSYTGLNTARVDVAVENDWAYEPAPQNFTYDVAIDVGGKTVYSKSALTHYHHARWRKTFWWGNAPQVNVRENTTYLMASKAVPNYDRSIVISEAALRGWGAFWSGPKTEPMGAGVANPGMPTTGGRPDIGLMPGWAVAYLLSMDSRARDVTLGTADLAGSWSVHYRDPKTGRPISLSDYPYMTILGHESDTRNPVTKKSEMFPTCANCTNPNIADSAHEPAFNYLAYLLTGDYYQLEELQFWAMWNAFKTNPGYRDNIKGLVYREQVRDQAWSMRNIAEAAFITPDRDRLKPVFEGIVANNLKWYNASYTNNPKANSLGVNIDGAAVVYNNKLGIAPWQDDFFTASIGRIAELGFPGARALLKYKAKFPISRMTDPGFCWIFGASYSIIVRASPTAPFYSELAQAYVPTLAANHPKLTDLASMSCAGQPMMTALRLRPGEMTGYANETTGFPSNLQPALAYSVDAGAPGADAAWRKFMARSIKPDYATGPQFAIVPRNSTAP